MSGQCDERVVKRGAMVQVTMSNDTVYVAVDGCVLLEVSGSIITVGMTLDNRPPAPEDDEP